MRLRLNKRTSINSIKIFKEKEMADFRKMLYAFAGVALLAGFTATASAQTCTVSSGVNPVVRAEGLTELVGDIVLTCVGGTPTLGGQTVPAVDFLVSLNQNITSKITASLSNGVNMNEALLIVDNPNTSAYNNAGGRPLTNCGLTGEDSNGQFGPGVCQIISTGEPSQTYDGQEGVVGDSTGVVGAGVSVACGGEGRPALNGFGCGRPNVFQGRQAVALLAGQQNVVQFLGVPFDAPAAGATRTIRITNIRVNASAFGVASPFSTVPVIATISISSSTTISLSNTSVQVGQVQLSLGSKNTSTSFLQCVAQTNAAAGNIRVQENFPTAFKVRNVSEVLANGNLVGGVGGTYVYNGGTSLAATDVDQNVPGAFYNTETGFFNNGTTPAPNPPAGFGSAVTHPLGHDFANNGFTSADARWTGISGAGKATQGTRFQITLSNGPLTGVTTLMPTTVALKNLANNTQTGLLILITGADRAGAGGSPSSLATSYVSVSGTTAVYEVVFSNSSAVEYADIVPEITYTTTNLGSNQPTPGNIQATVSYAPNYTSATTGYNLASATLPIPRFIPSGVAPTDIYSISKCVCDLLFPWVVGASSAGYVTSIVVANTSLDPGTQTTGTTNANGFMATPSFGPVTFWYYGTKGVSLDPSAVFSPATTAVSQTSSVTVPAGSYLAHIVTNAASGETAANGLHKLTGPFAGYVIAQAQFQYCHGVASVSGPGISPQTYLGLVMDQGSSLPRTIQARETLSQ